MAKLSTIESDVTAEVEGVWVDFIEDIRLLIARDNNPNFEKYMTNASTSAKRAMRMRKLDNEAFQKLRVEAMAHTVLLGWEHIQDENTGEEVEYSHEQALTYLTDPKLRDLFQFVLVISNDAELFRKQEQEEALKN